MTVIAGVLVMARNAASASGASPGATSGSGSGGSGSGADKGGTPTPLPGPSTLTGGQTVLALVIVAAALLAAGAVVIWARTRHGAHEEGVGPSYIRAWVAISLVLGLLLFCTLSFSVADTTLRSTLMGGLTASVGAAIAFYFSSNSAAQASQNLLTATGSMDTVPDVTGKNRDDAVSAMSKSSFKFEIDPPDPLPPGSALIESTTPNPGATAPKGSTVRAKFRQQ